MLACARIGAVHSVVFAGFSAESLASRVADCKSRVVVTTSGVMRGKKKLATKAIVDDALNFSKREGFEVRPLTELVLSGQSIILESTHLCKDAYLEGFGLPPQGDLLMLAKRDQIFFSFGCPPAEYTEKTKLVFAQLPGIQKQRWLHRLFLSCRCPPAWYTETTTLVFVHLPGIQQ